MVKRFDRIGPQFPKPPRLPTLLPGKERSSERDGRTLRPFSGPDIPLPPDTDPDRLARFEAWSAERGGSLLEFICWEFITFEKKLIEGVDWLFQYPIFGGRTQFGGFVLDFYFRDRGLGWNPLGARWHTLFAPDRARDRLAKVLLANRGITMVYMLESDLLTRPDYTLDKAWNGEELPSVKAVE